MRSKIFGPANYGELSLDELIAYSQSDSYRSFEATVLHAASEMVSDCPATPMVAAPPLVQGEVTLCERTNALIRGLDLVLDHHSVDSNIRVELAKQVHDYLDILENESMWLKGGKYLLAYPFALYLRNAPPVPPPFGAFKAKGSLNRWMKNRLLNYNRKNTHLWFSWMQCKRSAMPSSEDMVQKAYNDHFEILNKHDDADDEVIDEIFQDVTFIEHLDKIKKGMMHRLLKSKHHFSSREPSTSASFSSSRANLGSYGEIRDEMEDVSPHPFLSKEEIVDDIVRNISLYKTLEECLGIPVDVWYLDNVNLKDSDIHHDELHSMIFTSVGTARVIERRCPDRDMEEDWYRHLDSRYQSRKPSQLKAKIQGILEPMKVRVISKGPAVEYYAAKPIQKALHSTLRKMDCYRLIGRPLCPTDILDLKEKVEGLVEWFSVDYSAATDNLSWKYSGRILKYLIQDMNEHEQKLCLDVLGPHELHYPDLKGKYSYRGVMNRGQLMGSILSFPILCIANTGLYLRVTRDYQKTWTSQERLRAVLTNGDDQLYCAPPALWSEHIRLGKAVGLDMSVGKAYHHSRYTNVNSTSVDCPLDSNCPNQINFLNSGLFYGQNKVMGKVGDDQKDIDHADNSPRIVPVLNQVLRGALPGRQSELLRKWMNYHSSEFIKMDTVVQTRKGPHYRNLFLPISLGGMGIDAPHDWKWFATKQDKVFASTRINEYRENYSARPLQGYEITEITSQVSMPYCKSLPIHVPAFSQRGTIDIFKSFVSLKNCPPLYLCTASRHQLWET